MPSSARCFSQERIRISASWRGLVASFEKKAHDPEVEGRGRRRQQSARELDGAVKGARAPIAHPLAGKILLRPLGPELKHGLVLLDEAQLPVGEVLRGIASRPPRCRRRPKPARSEFYGAQGALGAQR